MSKYASISINENEDFNGQVEGYIHELNNRANMPKILEATKQAKEGTITEEEFMAKLYKIEADGVIYKTMVALELNFKPSSDDEELIDKIKQYKDKKINKKEVDEYLIKRASDAKVKDGGQNLMEYYRSMYRSIQRKGNSEKKSNNKYNGPVYKN